jgi:prolyl-tRNA editing enzyme YbaK/EbsC (Cys-tRNA(Pro) deacylase)
MSTLGAGRPDAADGIRILPAEARTAAQAAEPLGVEAGTIANSLTFRAVFLDRVEPLLAVTWGPTPHTSRRSSGRPR